MTWAILVINIKGGTGKSTVAQHLSERLVDEGHDVGVLDADIDSANLASRLGINSKVTFEGDHTIKPVEHNGMKVYSMENAFEDSSFSQTGQFMGEVVDNMINHSDWGDLDYMVVDCPPGSSDIFEELVRALRANILGAISVGISDAVEDTARLVTVCNHNWVPILGFIENMSGVYCHGSPVACDNQGGFEKHTIYPFGEGRIEKLVDNLEGNFIGRIPLCMEETSIDEAAPETMDNMIEAIHNANEPTLPDDNIGDPGFIRNMWETVKAAKDRMNQSINIEGVQSSFGVEGRDPLVIELELSDATGLKKVLNKVIITVIDQEVKPLSPSGAKRRGLSVDGGISLTSQDLFYSMKGEKEVMNSVTGDVITTPYSIVDAVKMGDAEIWGERTINRLAVLDRILSEVIDMDDMQEILRV